MPPHSFYHRRLLRLLGPHDSVFVLTCSGKIVGPYIHFPVQSIHFVKGGLQSVTGQLNDNQLQLCLNTFVYIRFQFTEVYLINPTERKKTTTHICPDYDPI